MIMNVNVQYHFEKVPFNRRALLQDEFMKNRNVVVRIFNAHIDEVNNEWDLTGKPATFGDYLEDINPEYVAFIKDRIQPFIDEFNKSSEHCWYDIDEYGDIIGRLPFNEDSRIWITLHF